MEIKIIKKGGYEEPWSDKKIKSAISKSAERVGMTLSSDDKQKVCDLALQAIDGMTVHVKDLHVAVECALAQVNNEVADSYKQYRNYKTEFVEIWDDIYKQTQNVIYRGDRENANFLSTLTSTKGSLIRGYVTKDLYKKFNLNHDEAQAIEDGFIYIHDLKDLIFGSINCCLFDMANVLKGGFEMANLKYSEPSGALSALQVIGDVTLSASAQQFGGFTIPEIDKTVLPYCKKSLEKHQKEGFKWGVDVPKHYAWEKLKEELNQGFQSLEMKLNSVPSSRGDFAFTTFSFGNLDEGSEEDKKIQKLICETMLKIRMKGQGKGEPVVFPKLIFLYSQEQYDTSNDYKDLVNLGMKCSSKAMYPDWLAIDTKGYVADIYKETGKVISAMGCRAYLSDFKGENGESVFVGRANIGAASLNLPMIWMKSEGDISEFYYNIMVYMDMIRNFHKKRYDLIANTPCSSNPMMFCEGGGYKGNKALTDNIGYDIVKSFTASFGITALNELNMLMEGKPLHESDGELVNQVVDFINNQIDKYKQEDGYLYALYGVPAESLAGTQLRQFKEMYGVIEGVSDREYFSNSFHCHVTADITPFEKQDLEERLFHKVNGGHIQYTRFNTPDNVLAIKQTVLRGMHKGFYSGVNFDLVICEECGHKPNHDVDHCPNCGSEEIMLISRLCGYLGYGKAKGDTRFNDSKLAEVKERVSM